MPTPSAPLRLAVKPLDERRTCPTLVGLPASAKGVDHDNRELPPSALPLVSTANTIDERRPFDTLPAPPLLAAGLLLTAGSRGVGACADDGRPDVRVGAAGAAAWDACVARSAACRSVSVSVLPRPAKLRPAAWSSRDKAERSACVCVHTVDKSSGCCTCHTADHACHLRLSTACSAFVYVSLDHHNARPSSLSLDPITLCYVVLLYFWY